MKNVIITGASGPLGLVLIEECIKKKTEVLAVVRPHSKNKHKIPNNGLVKIIDCDISDIEQITGTVDNTYEVFYHLAWANTDVNGRDNPSAQYKNIEYILNAVNVAKKLGCRAFIGAGSQAEYGLKSHVISTSTLADPITPYGITKYAAGRLCSILCKQLNIRYNWARIFSVYGPHEHEYTMIHYCINSLLNGNKPILTKCEQIWDFLYCKDAARALYLIGKKGKEDTVYCLGSGKSNRLLEYVYEIRNNINPNLPLGIGEKKYSDNQIMYLCADIENLTKDTGYVPQYSFKEGICETINWYKEKNIIHK